MDTYQGKIGSVSPAMGNYDIDVWMNIDKRPESTVSGGVTGAGTLEPVRWGMSYTGIVGTNFTNAKHGF